MSQTPRLELPFLAAGQAQKHVTLNEALLRLDTAVQIGIISRTLTSAPASPQEGARYIIPPGAAGSWASRTGQIAAFQDGGWTYLVPRTGWLAWLGEEEHLLVFHDNQWRSFPVALQNLSLAGVNTTADALNRLSVASSASLFTHVGSGHQLKINKAQAGDLASLCLQNNYSGRAEFSLVGENILTLRQSSNGTDWYDVFRAGNGTISIPNSAAYPGFAVGPHEMSSSFVSGMATIELSARMSGDRFCFFDFHASDAQPDFSSRIIRHAGAHAALEIENVGNGPLVLRSSGAGKVLLETSGVSRLEVSSAGHLLPVTDNAVSLGASGRRFSTIWAANGVIQTSDQRDKSVEQPLSGPAATDVVDGVEPVLFRWKTGGRSSEVSATDLVPLNPDNPHSKTRHVRSMVERAMPGRRRHAGFVAQQMGEALLKSGLDCGAWGLEDTENADSRQWLRPDQLLAVLWSALRQTRQELAEVRATLERR